MTNVVKLETEKNMMNFAVDVLSDILRSTAAFYRINLFRPLVKKCQEKKE